MKAKNSLKKLTLVKTTIAHLEDEQMTAARGGSCGETWFTQMCPLAHQATRVTC